MIRYINAIFEGNQRETIDEFEIKNLADRKEFKRVLEEYRSAMPYAEVYPSQRACKGWKEE